METTNKSTTNCLAIITEKETEIKKKNHKSGSQADAIIHKNHFQAKAENIAFFT